MDDETKALLREIRDELERIKAALFEDELTQSLDFLQRQERRQAAVKHLKALLKDKPSYIPVTVVFQPDDGPATMHKLNPRLSETS